MNIIINIISIFRCQLIVYIIFLVWFIKHSEMLFEILFSVQSTPYTLYWRIFTFFWISPLNSCFFNNVAWYYNRSQLSIICNCIIWKILSVQHNVCRSILARWRWDNSLHYFKLKCDPRYRRTEFFYHNLVRFRNNRFSGFPSSCGICIMIWWWHCRDTLVIRG